MNTSPPKPQGTSKEALFMIWIWEMLTGWLCPVDSPDIKIKRGTRGFSMIFARSAPGTVSSVSGITYEGDYDPTKAYKKGMIMRKQTGNNQGLWICVVDNLAAGTEPVFPEPKTTGGTNNWDWWNFAPQASVDCQNGNRVIYVSSSAPIT